MLVNKKRNSGGEKPWFFLLSSWSLSQDLERCSSTLRVTYPGQVPGCPWKLVPQRDLKTQATNTLPKRAFSLGERMVIEWGEHEGVLRGGSICLPVQLSVPLGSSNLRCIRNPCGPERAEEVRDSRTGYQSRRPREVPGRASNPVPLAL